MKNNLLKVLKQSIEVEHIPLDYSIITIITLSKLVENGDVIFEKDMSGDQDYILRASQLIKRKMSCGNESVFIYYGYRDEKGITHIVDNGSLMAVIELINDVNASEFSAIQKRRFNQMEIRLEYISSFKRNMGEVLNDFNFFIH